MKIYFIRHAEGRHNKEQDFQLVDPELTINGKRQCEFAKIKLSNIMFEKAIVSPLVRAIQTARYLVPDAIIEISELVREVVANPCDYRTSSVTLKNHFQNLSFHDLQENRNYNAIEMDHDVVKRCNIFFNYLKTCHCENILVVGHGEFFSRFLLQFGVELNIKTEWFENCEIRMGEL